MYDLVILAALLRGPAYGYALKKTAGLIFGHGDMHNNIVYPALKRLMENGWVQQSNVPGDRGQNRKQYRLTSTGKRHLIAQISASSDAGADGDGAFLFRVALFDYLPQARRHEILSARRAFLTARAAQLADLKKTTRPRSYGAAVFDRLQAQVADELEWIGRLES
jgi:DNA-binding PadR family transcriptional regulator